ncbi:MAG TPA: FAD-dependent oxidoreductase [Bryobacteraceae bacterium]|nr:FAD-dependent oxidoreductase [Bryobacteraceae bacterium]
MGHPAKRLNLSRLLGGLLLALPCLAASPTYRVLDPQAVPVSGDPAQAVLTISKPANVKRQSCDVVVAGGGMGGVAAALAAARNGLTVCMTEATEWLGGQMTSQGVSAFDEHRWIETSGPARTYQDLRRRIRAKYEPKLAADHRQARFNPGACWVGYLCFEPKVGLEVLDEMIAPYRQSGALRILMRTVPVAAERAGGRLQSLLVYGLANRRFTSLEGKVFIDATELGDVLPLAGAGFRSGAEARHVTGEPDADETGNPALAQSFTYPFVLATGPRPDLPFTQPPGYDEARSQYGLYVDYGEGNIMRYGMFAHLPKTPGSFWTYRRLVAKDQYVPGAFPSDLAMINWPGNDVCDARYLSPDPLEAARALQHGKQVALGFAWWLRHEAPQDSGAGKGTGNLVLRGDVLGSKDGLSLYPYIRESRRMESLQMVREQDVAEPWNPGARARHFDDTAAIGFYGIDIHGCGPHQRLPQAKPYQVPFGSLISKDLPNLLAGAKNLDVTHIVNGAYRLHPIEWAIGEASGTLAAWAVKSGRQPAEVGRDAAALRTVQRNLLADGHPLIWFDDVNPDDPAFAAVQYAALTGLMPPEPETLHFRPKDPATSTETASALRKLGDLIGRMPKHPGVLSRVALAEWLMRRLTGPRP